jgi:uncharacterized protein YdhG (YjbR/CyaY superfamily)
VASDDDAEALAYIDAIPAEHRPLFDRVRGLIVDAFPDVRIVWSYKMPTFVVGRRRLYVAAWAHGVSLYGWSSDDDGGFAALHPELLHGRGTIRLRPDDATVSDEELSSLLRASLG